MKPECLSQAKEALSALADQLFPSWKVSGNTAQEVPRVVQRVSGRALLPILNRIARVRACSKGVPSPPPPTRPVGIEIEVQFHKS